MKLRGLILLFPLLLSSAAAAASDNDAELVRIQQEKASLQSIRKQLESRLGELGKELRALDQSLVEARAARREVDSRIGETDRNLKQLRRRKGMLQSDIRRLEKQMIEQSVAAYQRASHEPGWMDAFAGVSVTEIPHRRKMLQFAMLSQEKERLEWQGKIAELAEVEKLEISNREALVRLRREREQREIEVAKRVDEKRALADRVKRDVGLNREKEKQLSEQEKALKRLLEGLSSGLFDSDKAAKHKSARSRKGRLPWPLKGKVVASFGSRPASGQPKLAGVQLVPVSTKDKGRQIKAIADGQVRYADWFGGYGLMMIVDHGDGLISVYAHNDALYWQMGDWVEAGQVLADAGSTGWVEGVRLYFEVRDKGNPVDPKKWCRR